MNRACMLSATRLNVRSRFTWYLAGTVLFNLVLFCWLVLRWGGQNVVLPADNIAQFAGPLLVLPLCWNWARRARDGSGARTASLLHGSGRMSPPLIGLSILCFAVGQIIWAFYELVAHQTTPFPSSADIFFSLEYPLLAVGVLLLPSRPMSVATRLRLGLDGLIVLAAIVTFSWFFILGPTILQGGESMLAKVVGTSYPMWDLALAACLIALAVRAGEGVPRSALVLLSLALLTEIGADSYFDFATLRNTYATGALPDVGWPLSCMLLGLGAYVLAHARATSSEQSAEHGATSTKLSWGGLIPYALVPAVFGLLLYVSRVPQDPSLRLGVEIGSAILVLLVVLRQILAIEDNRRLSSRLARQNSELEAANNRLQALATTDPHTDVLNHRAIVESLERELERAHRYRRPCSLLFVDLDHFKIINDTLGHQTGDLALRQLATIASGELRGIDLIGRWGGEEFVIILPETSADTAQTVAERLRTAVAAQPFGGAAGVRLTCSIGIATYPDDATESSALVEGADRAMYVAKRLGRNQVRLARAPLPAGLVDAVGKLEPRGQESLVATVEALARLVDARDLQTGRHADEVGQMAMRLALALGLKGPEVRTIGLAGRLHDVGKIAIPDSILQKPARLTADEWEIIHRHPVVGADVLAHIPELAPLAPIVLSHHERWNGCGYPGKLKGDDIPLGARIVAVADALNAMTSDRPYRVGLSLATAMNEITQHSGTQFDPRVVAALHEILSADSEGLQEAG